MQPIRNFDASERAKFKYEKMIRDISRRRMAKAQRVRNYVYGNRAGAYFAPSIVILFALVPMAFGQNKVNIIPEAFKMSRVMTGSQFASVKGVATDPAGAAIPRVLIEFSLDSAKPTKLVSDDAGEFLLMDVGPGENYQIVFWVDGFKKLVITNVKIGRGEILDIHVVMEPHYDRGHDMLPPLEPIPETEPARPFTTFTPRRLYDSPKKIESPPAKPAAAVVSEKQNNI